MPKTLLNSYTVSLALTLATSFLNTALAQPRIITTVAGTAASGYSGDGGPAVAARLMFPVSVDVDASGNLFVGDYDGNVIRKVASTGIITTVAGNGTMGYSGDGGPATAAQLYAVASVVSDNSGNLYISDQANHVIRKVDAAGIISTVVGTGTAGFSGDGGPGTAAMLNKPGGIALDDAGNLYIADEDNAVIRKMNPAGIITSYAGIPDSFGYTGNGGPATAAKLGHVFVVCTDHSGNLYFSEGYPQRTIRKIDAAGTMSLVAGDDSAAVYTGGSVAATAVRIGGASGLAIDDSGNVYASLSYYADGGTRIVKINTAGVLSTFAGNGHGTHFGNGGDGGDPLDAVIDPLGICLGNSGDMYLASGTRVRRIAPNTTSVELVSQTPGVTIFPNPCSDRVNVSGLSGEGSLLLIDITGRILLEQQYNTVTRSASFLLPEALTAGTYVLRVKGDQIVASSVVTVEK